MFLLVSLFRKEERLRQNNLDLLMGHAAAGSLRCDQGKSSVTQGGSDEDKVMISNCHASWLALGKGHRQRNGRCRRKYSSLTVSTKGQHLHAAANVRDLPTVFAKMCARSHTGRDGFWQHPSASISMSCTPALCDRARHIATRTAKSSACSFCQYGLADPFTQAHS